MKTPRKKSVAAVDAASQDAVAKRRMLRAARADNRALRARLEAVRKRLCNVGLHPGYHDTPEKAAEAVFQMIAYFRREFADPPHDLQGAVLRKMGVDGWVREEEGDSPARLKLVGNLPR